jgi:hypothetical protein
LQISYSYLTAVNGITNGNSNTELKPTVASSPLQDFGAFAATTSSGWLGMLVFIDSLFSVLAHSTLNHRRVLV